MSTRESKPQNDSQLIKAGQNFLSGVARLPIAQIHRDQFLTSQLQKYGVSTTRIERALEVGPAHAGIPMTIIEEMARKAIRIETNRATGMAVAAGIPGGLWGLATVPADVAQYYVHAFRLLQKLAYIYGWQSFLNNTDDLDDETLELFTVFLGVMMGVAQANVALQATAIRMMPNIAKRIATKPLMKTWYYPLIKNILKTIGIHINKGIFGKSVAKVLPVAGGFISGGLTFTSMKTQSKRLTKHLKSLPPAWPNGEVPEKYRIEEDESE